MEELKTIKELEVETGMFLKKEQDPSKKMSRKDFSRMAIDKGFVGVSYDQRVKFLRDNGYKVNRKNLLDVELVARNSKEYRAEQEQE